MKIYRVTILEPAGDDIEEAYAWLADHNNEAAIRWYNRLMEVIYSLDTFPER